MLLKQVFSFILLLGISIDLLACTCDDIPQYDQYSFIALVQIDRIIPDESGYSISFQILQNFKGSDINSCRVNNLHPLHSEFLFSCSLVINENEEWIICATNRNGVYITSFCSKSLIYRWSNHELDHRFIRTNNEVSNLRNIFQEETSENKNGKKVTYYDNGQIEIEEDYKDGELNGDRFVYYKNGILRLYQCFDNGKKEDQEFLINSNGLIKGVCEYLNGIAQKCQYYINSKLDFEVTLNDQGKYEKVFYKE